ncbi:hypothetical protein EAH72_08130 [Pseudomonas caspiana]|uniref:Uncharacterized protein n=1 Tax=Pseudomonas mandelii TaxID=75612 RepID=A0A502ICZ9_9PSED|nr:hypothetical protein EAH74_16725 [Pseudomonas mandelii]TPG96950.1 hypothetical protein EAH72_08130 [Pseudomonas caspiana]
MPTASSTNSALPVSNPDTTSALVGAAEGCDLLIFGVSDDAKDQKIAAFGSSYVEHVHPAHLSVLLAGISAVPSSRAG